MQKCFTSAPLPTLCDRFLSPPSDCKQRHVLCFKWCDELKPSREFRHSAWEEHTSQKAVSSSKNSVTLYGARA
eukprot:6176043-Pleurochrysis_carterae.AAC.6